MCHGLSTYVDAVILQNHLTAANSCFLHLHGSFSLRGNFRIHLPRLKELFNLSKIKINQHWSKIVILIKNIMFRFLKHCARVLPPNLQPSKPTRGKQSWNFIHSSPPLGNCLQLQQKVPASFNSCFTPPSGKFWTTWIVSDTKNI